MNSTNDSVELFRTCYGCKGPPVILTGPHYHIEWAVARKLHMAKPTDTMGPVFHRQCLEHVYGIELVLKPDDWYYPRQWWVMRDGERLVHAVPSGPGSEDDEVRRKNAWDLARYFELRQSEYRLVALRINLP